MNGFKIGSIVRCRNREWVILPSSDEEIFMLRPLTGGESEVCGIYKELAKLGLDRVEPASFPLPTPQDAGDAIGAELLWNAARLTLRDGAGPFRSLGRISIRPRPYQFVPLLMALRLDPISLLIADDVGVGKTIEALLIARELLDRGEIKRICVLCPPYLCNQWKEELLGKFHIDAVVISSGTVSQLERNLPSGDHSIFGYYQHIIVSIDYAKSESHRPNFLTHCPELVIVDEAHGASQVSTQTRGQQQRHELLKKVSEKQDRHLILLTATPHSGVEESFLSLIGLLQPDFAKLNFSQLAEGDRDALARYFVQRRRADVVNWLGEETPFPDRDSKELTYDLSPLYRELFNKVYDFSRDLVRTGETLSGWKKRVRYWTALALLRCVMSSPKAAIATLSKRDKGLLTEDEDASDENYAPYIYEPTDEETIDAQPVHVVQKGEVELEGREERRFTHFARLAQELIDKVADSKIEKCTRIIKELLEEGYKPIVWCRYIATSDYVAEELDKSLKNKHKDLRIISVTGALVDEERRALVDELSNSKQRVLVATDCLSEGINLQEHFNAVVHYDLPWNPNRLEQREGRVDRFGQHSPKVKAILFYGQDNPVDGAVLDVLLRKAKIIHKRLGITVPVPVDSETLMESVLKSLFFRGPEAQQLPLFEDSVVKNVHGKWEKAESREKESRTRFAQRAIKPDEVQRELKETDAVLGDPDAVKHFVLNACQRFNVNIRSGRDGVFTMTSQDRFPENVRSVLPGNTEFKISFKSPAPENVTYLGRNHPFVSELSQYLLEEALIKGSEARATRCGVIKTQSVNSRTTLLLLRLRFMVEEPDKKPLLSEEVLVCGFHGFPPDKLEWLEENEATDLLKTAKPDANILPGERNEILEEVLGWWESLQTTLENVIQIRAKKLEESHRRVRKSARLSRRGLSVRPHFPSDLLGTVVLLPIPGGAVS